MFPLILPFSAICPIPDDALSAIPSVASFSALISNTDPVIPWTLVVCRISAVSETSPTASLSKPVQNIFLFWVVAVAVPLRLISPLNDTKTILSLYWSK